MADPVSIPALPIGDRSSDSVARHTDNVKLGGQRRNLQIQWLRALAATMVMLYHTASYQQLMLHNPTLIGMLGAGFGYFGVGLFFAISGYLMSIGIRVQKPAVFLAHRIIRIYPIYVLLCVLFWIVRSRFYAVSVDPASLALMPYPGVKYSALTVEWTLVFEIAFYAGLFAIAWLGLQRRINAIALVWLAAIIAYSAFNPDPGLTLVMPYYRMLLNCACAPMAAGLLLPAALKLRVPSWALGLVLVACWALGEHYHDTYEAGRWFYGTSAVCLLWIMLRVPEDRAAAAGRPGRILSRYGDYSYALYLCHVPIIQLLYLALPDTNIYALWALCVASALGAAMVFGEIDLSLYSRLKQLVRGVPPRLVGGLALTYMLVYAAVSGVGAIQYHLYYEADARAGELARQIAAASPMTSAESAGSIMSGLGYVQSDRVRGAVDKAEWFRDTSQMQLTLWAMTYPRHAAATPVYIAVFNHGALVASGTPDVIRGDVMKAYGISPLRRVWAEKDVRLHQDDCEAGGIVVLAFTADRQFAILPGPERHECK